MRKTPLRKQPAQSPLADMKSSGIAKKPGLQRQSDMKMAKAFGESVRRKKLTD